jgi:hypothetical protein
MVSPTIEAGQRLEVGVERGASGVVQNPYIFWITWGQRGRRSLRRDRIGWCMGCLSLNGAGSTDRAGDCANVCSMPAQLCEITSTYSGPLEG